LRFECGKRSADGKAPGGVFEEAREVAWLVSIIGGLSVAALGLAVALMAA
jgi:hypothetical protein